MTDIIDLMQVAAVFTFAVVGYILVFQKSGHKKVGHYSLPDHPNTKTVVTSSIFEADGLRIENLIHYKSLRITFNGLLRCRVRTAYTSDYNDDELRFIKFNFIWSATAPPHHYPNDWSLKLRSTALATEPWRSGDWLNYLSTPDFGGYDQFGSLFGQVFIDDGILSFRTETTEMTTYELNLPGIRQRRCLPFISENQRRYAYFYGVCQDGTVFVIGASSYEESMTHLLFGYVRTSNGKTHSISRTNFQLMYIADDPSLLAPKALSFQFKADKKIYSTTVHFSRKTLVPLVGAKPVGWTANIIPVEIGLNGGRGVGTAVLWYADPSKNQSIVTDNSSRFYLNPTETKPDNRLTFSFNENEAKSVLIAGGKGASLALLSSVRQTFFDKENFDFHVPQGFIVSVSAFNLQVGRNVNLDKQIRDVKDVAYGIVDGKLQDVCERTIEEFKSTQLENGIINAVTKSFEQIVRNNQVKDLRFAVRSSAIGEDSDDASSAGQNETFLGLRNLPEILDSIKLCWASLFTYQSVEYRRQHIQPVNTEMAVVVQIMVPADCAGVLFTRHPASGDPSKILITANYGLGETVVSGNVDPDTYIVYRKYKVNSLSVLERNIGSKKHYLHVSTSSQGTNVVEQDISPANQQTSCLAKIGVTIEKLYGNARDIEWAIHENTVYLLQSRPITTLNSYTNWELLHELDTPIMSLDDYTTFANVDEVFPEVITPLTLTTITTVLNRSTSEMILKEKDYYEGLFSRGFGFTNYRVTMDIFKVFLYIVNDPLEMQDKMQSISICGHEFITPEMHRIAINRNGVASGIQKLGKIMDVVQAIWKKKAEIKAVDKFASLSTDRYSKHNLTEFHGNTASQFHSYIEFEIDDEDRLGFIFVKHGNITTVSVFYQLISMMVLAEGRKELTNEHYADIALMLGCIPVESAEVPKMLKDIANDIYLNGKSDEFESIRSNKGMEWLEMNCVSAATLINEFLEKHGHRSLKEFDLATKAWEMKQEQIIEMIQATCRSSREILKERKDKIELTNDEIIKRLKIPKKNITRKILSFLLTLCKSSVQKRETAKSTLIAFVHELRKAYLHLADLMLAEGLLPNKELIFYMTRYELSDLLKESPNTGINKYAIINKAMRRMKLFPLWSTYRFNEVNKGIIKPINDRDDFNHNSGKMVTGTPVCEGLVTARACVLYDFSEVHKIRSGDILVTHSTDIGWSPYFPVLGGVVTELGGLISHGAVVAREYGLPCIVGAVGATTILKFGDTITLNAGKGYIVKVSDTENGSAEDHTQNGSH